MPGICNPNKKVAATVDPPIAARAVPRLRFMDLLIRSPDTNPNGIINREIKRKEAEPGITKYTSWLRANHDMAPRNVRPIATVIDLM